MEALDLQRDFPIGLQRPRTRGVGVGLLDGHDLGQISALETRIGARGRDGSRLVDRVARDDATVLRALVTQQPGQPARIDIGDRHHAVGLQVFAEAQLRAPARRLARDFSQHQAGNVNAVRLAVFGVAADVADMRVSQRDDLLAVRGIGHDLLVAGHRRIENDFPDGLTVGANRNTFKNAAVGEGKQGRSVIRHRLS